MSVGPAPWVAHSVVVYLPMSENWIWSQMAFQQRHRPLVLTKRTENLEAFPVHAQQGRIVAAYTGVTARLGAKIGRGWGGFYPAHRRAIEESRPVLLHSHFGKGGFEDRALARACGLPHVVSVYGADIWRLGVRPEWRDRYNRVLFPEADLFVAEGPAMARRMVELGCPEEKIAVNPLGVDVERIPFLPRQPDKTGTIRCLMAGRAIEKKGMIYGLRAFAEVASRHPSARLTVMTWGEANYKQDLILELHRTAEQRGIADRVSWLGLRPYDEYLRIVRDSQVFLCPSVIAQNGDAEGGCPVTAIELAASGMPIVGFAHCDIPEVVQDGISGRLVRERDEPALAAALDDVLSRPNDFPAMGRAARTRIATEYDVRKQAARLEQIYDRVQSGAPGSA